MGEPKYLLMAMPYLAGTATMANGHNSLLMAGIFTAPAAPGDRGYIMVQSVVFLPPTNYPCCSGSRMGQSEARRRSAAVGFFVFQQGGGQGD